MIIMKKKKTNKKNYRTILQNYLWKECIKKNESEYFISINFPFLINMRLVNNFMYLNYINHRRNKTRNKISYVNCIGLAWFD